jgi:hypothetical protein
MKLEEYVDVSIRTASGFKETFSRLEYEEFLHLRSKDYISRRPLLAGNEPKPCSLVERERFNFLRKKRNRIVYAVQKEKRSESEEERAARILSKKRAKLHIALSMRFAGAIFKKDQIKKKKKAIEVAEAVRAYREMISKGKQTAS